MFTGDDQYRSAKSKVAADRGEVAEDLMSDHYVPGELDPFGFFRSFIFKEHHRIRVHCIMYD
jgi:hypothetical protein